MSKTLMYGIFFGTDDECGIDTMMYAVSLYEKGYIHLLSIDFDLPYHEDVVIQYHEANAFWKQPNHEELFVKYYSRCDDDDDDILHRMFRKIKTYAEHYKYVGGFFSTRSKDKTFVFDDDYMVQLYPDVDNMIIIKETLEYFHMSIDECMKKEFNKNAKIVHPDRSQ